MIHDVAHDMLYVEGYFISQIFANIQASKITEQTKYTSNNSYLKEQKAPKD